MGVTLPQEHRDLLDRLLTHPPQIHALTGERSDAELGVWSTEREAYELIADRCGPGSATLETGIGISTALLAALGARHTCVAPFAQEADRLRAYCAEVGIDTDTLTLEIGFSDEVLPRLDRDELDLVLVDGGHGFPTPMIDWFYAAGRLRRGGVAILDDVQLPAVAMLVDVVDHDERWHVVARTPKWIAYERRSAGSVREDWWQQPWFPTVAPPAPFVRRVLRTARRVGGRVATTLAGRTERG